MKLGDLQLSPRHLINGRWEIGTTTGISTNPSDTREVVAEYARADRNQTELAVRAAADELVGLEGEMALLRGVHAQAEVDRLRLLGEAEAARAQAAQLFAELVEERAKRQDAEAQLARLGPLGTGAQATGDSTNGGGAAAGTGAAHSDGHGSLARAEATAAEGTA